MENHEGPAAARDGFFKERVFFPIPSLLASPPRPTSPPASNINKAKGSSHLVAPESPPFRQFHTLHQGTTSGINEGTIKTSFNSGPATPNPALAEITFELATGKSGLLLVTMVGDEGRLTINGFSLAALPPPPAASIFETGISPNPTPGLHDFTWNGPDKNVYDLPTSTDIATPTIEWPVSHDGTTLQAAIPSAGTTTTLTAVPTPDPRRFFAVREEDAPPPRA